MNITIELNNGVEMPLAGIGTFMLSPDEAEASCVSAFASGYRLIDTANAYVNERAVGRAMKKSGLTGIAGRLCEIWFDSGDYWSSAGNGGAGSFGRRGFEEDSG